MTAVTKDGADLGNCLSLSWAWSPHPAASGPTRATTTRARSPSAEKKPDNVAGVVNLRKLAAVCFKYDPNSLVHGVFLEKIAGRLRHPRALSAFIEASEDGPGRQWRSKVRQGVAKTKVAGVNAKGGYGNVPFHRTEFTAKP